MELQRQLLLAQGVLGLEVSHPILAPADPRQPLADASGWVVLSSAVVEVNVVFVIRADLSFFQTYRPSPLVLTVDPLQLQFQVTVGQEKYNIPKLHDTQAKEGDDFDDERDYNSCNVVDFNVDRATKNAFGGLWDKERCV